jgi:UDP-glucose 4-epimerase
MAPRRAGDIAACYANPSRAAELLGWRAERDLDAMCQDAWNWQVRNPHGFKPAEPVEQVVLDQQTCDGQR